MRTRISCCIVASTLLLCTEARGVQSPAPTPAPAPAPATTCPNQAYPYNAFPAFPTTLRSTLPEDVAICWFNTLKTQSPPDLPRLNRLFEIFAWQTFISLNWPADDQEKLQTGINDKGTRWYLGWKSTSDVFKPDGSKPSPWDFPNDTRAQVRLLEKDLAYRVLESTAQAGSSLPLVDQNGNYVYYDVLINQTLFKRIDKYSLYNLDGQIAYSGQPEIQSNGMTLPWGTQDSGDVGSVVVKLAWKVLDESKGDIPARFVTRESCIQDPAQPQARCRPRQVGLVGVNVARKVFSAKQQWVWMAFEHVDNLRVSDLESHGGKRLKPLFFDPGCPTCPVNQGPDPRLPVLQKTQVVRVMPISRDTEALNAEVRALLGRQESVLGFYQLIGVQWPTNGLTAPSSQEQLPGGLTNASGGEPNRAFLANAVIETYLQGGNQDVASLHVGRPGDRRVLFTSASCMGCHFDAPLAAGADVGLVWTRQAGDQEAQKRQKVKTPAWGAAQSGDFLFMFQRAAWKQQ